MKKFLVWLLVFISLGALLLRFSDKWAEIFFGIKATSGISILSQPSEAVVFINDKEVGKTPYEDKNLDVKDYLVKLSKEGASWQGKVALTAGTVTVINRDLSPDPTSSAGEILTLKKGKGLTITSNPAGADIEINGKSYGKTPVTPGIEPGDHTILVNQANYLKRSIRANLPKGYNLTISVDLALSEADLTEIQTPVTTKTLEIVVKNTPTGFLRVRNKASLNSAEIARVKPGDSLILLEELGSWNRVRLSNNTEGFVSSDYVEKKSF
ncbi:PEGA domain-containing protein [Candidatus Daviesbacteria bacterium]|nr:PEGA domain-containing protein [Candidatus Daviesbacteria bacterium]